MNVISNIQSPNVFEAMNFETVKTQFQKCVKLAIAHFTLMLSNTSYNSADTTSLRNVGNPENRKLFEVASGCLRIG
jgi:hypothetical protein